MILAVDPGVLIGSFGTALAAIVGSLALLQNRRTEHKSAMKDEVDQAFNLQDLAMKELEASNTRLTLEIERVRGRNDAMHEALNTSLSKVAELKGEHKKCQIDLNNLGDELRATKEQHSQEMGSLIDRLHIAEAKIAELGG